MRLAYRVGSGIASWFQCGVGTMPFPEPALQLIAVDELRGSRVDGVEARHQSICRLCAFSRGRCQGRRTKRLEGVSVR